MHVRPDAASDGGQGGAGGLTRVSAAKSVPFGDAIGMPAYCREVGRFRLATFSVSRKSQGPRLIGLRDPFD